MVIPPKNRGLFGYLYKFVTYILFELFSSCQFIYKSKAPKRISFWGFTIVIVGYPYQILALSFGAIYRESFGVTLKAEYHQGKLATPTLTRAIPGE